MEGRQETEGTVRLVLELGSVKQSKHCGTWRIGLLLPSPEAHMLGHLVLSSTAQTLIEPRIYMNRETPKTVK